jgi:hypothetical protein
MTGMHSFQPEAAWGLPAMVSRKTGILPGLARVRIFAGIAPSAAGPPAASDPAGTALKRSGQENQVSRSLHFRIQTHLIPG